MFQNCSKFVESTTFGGDGHLFTHSLEDSPLGCCQSFAFLGTVVSTRVPQCLSALLIPCSSLPPSHVSYLGDTTQQVFLEHHPWVGPVLGWGHKGGG
jgi:hypothetical protein